MSGVSDQRPPMDPRGQYGKGPGDEATEPMLPPAPGWPALPAPHPGELLLPAPRAEEQALSAGASPALLLPSLQTGTTASAPAALPALAGRRWRDSRRWTMGIGMVSLALLVMCALPVWAFGLWGVWVNNSHAPPPVLARLDPGGQGASEAGWSPDGRYVAEQITLAGGGAGAVVLWDTRTRREVRRFVGADGGLAAAWSPDGAWLATTDGTRALLWGAAEVEQPGGDVTPTARLAAPDAHEAVTGLAWAKDGNALAMVDEGGLGIWRAAGVLGWEQVRYFADGPCAMSSCGRRVLWSPDGAWLLAFPWHGQDGASGIGVWAAETWNEQPLLKAAAALAWSPDGSRVVVRNADETTLSALRAGQWTVDWTVNPNADVHQSYRVFPQAAGWSPDGRWLAGSMDGWVDLWPTDTRATVWVWEEQARDVGVYVATSLAWSPDGRTLAVTTDGLARLTLYDLSHPTPRGAGPPIF